MAQYLERCFRACVVRNVPGSNSALPITFYQYHLHESVCVPPLILSISYPHRSIAYKKNKEETNKRDPTISLK